MRNIRGRIERLEATEPEEIVLILRDGTHFHHCGPALEFCMEAMEDFRENRSTPLAQAVLDTVAAEGCALLWQLLQIMAHGFKAYSDTPPQQG